MSSNLETSSKELDNLKEVLNDEELKNTNPLNNDQTIDNLTNGSTNVNNDSTDNQTNNDPNKQEQKSSKPEFNNPKFETTRMKDYLKRAVKATSQYNKLINQERKDERAICFDLQTYTLHYPLGLGADNRMLKRNLETGRCNEKQGKYPIAVLPGHYQNKYRKYTSQELKYLPVNTVYFGPVIADAEKLPPLLTRIDEDSFSDSDSDSSASTEHSCCCDEQLCKRLKLDVNSEDKCNCQSDESESDEEEEYDESPPKLINFSTNFQNRADAVCDLCKKNSLIKQDGSIDNLIHCSDCNLSFHPVCLDMGPEIVEEIKNSLWLCSACKRCIVCGDVRFEKEMLICDLCDRSFHMQCIGLKQIPSGKWFCKHCSTKQKYIQH